jgi:alkylation response protein AidB-like acyl-CoA dehydrogenase
VRFTFTAEQLEFRDAVRDLLDKQCTAVDVRAAWSSESGRSPARWKALADMGVVGLTVPSEYGGLGMDEVGLVLLLEEAGRAGLPEPLLETTAVGAPLLASVGAATGDWLSKVAAGSLVLAVGLEAQPYVADAHVADLLLLEHQGRVHALPRDAVELSARPSVDGGRRLFSVVWAPVTPLAIPAAELALAFDRGALGAAAELLGISRRLIDITAGYARERHQFGQPIGSFQAVKHHLADALLALELARPVVYRAAWSIAAGDPDRSVHVSMAKAYASNAADRAARVALQVHGALGYTWECDIHLWMKKGWALGAAWGDAAWHRRRVAEAVI